MARFICAALCVVAFACVWSFPLRASDIQFAAGVACDTAEQAAMFGSLVEEKGAEKALAAVNEDAKDPVACVIDTFAFIEGERGAVIKVGGKDYEVTAVNVVAVRTPQGFERINPLPLFTLLPAKGNPA